MHAEHPNQRVECHTQIADVINPPVLLVRAEKLIATLAQAAEVAAVRGCADIVQT
jgi:hypothetical protein